jgi:hypothetical protein
MGDVANDGKRRSTPWAFLRATTVFGGDVQNLDETKGYVLKRCCSPSCSST